VSPFDLLLWAGVVLAAVIVLVIVIGVVILIVALVVGFNEWRRGETDDETQIFKGGSK
jgi:hypothetical protein